jgi:hypothetical protein
MGHLLGLEFATIPASVQYHLVHNLGFSRPVSFYYRWDHGKLDNDRNNNRIGWIECLLQMPIAEYRKNAISRILAPYLINIRQLSYAQAFEITKEWLDKCNQLRPLASSINFNCKIKAALDFAATNGVSPMRPRTIQSRNHELHNQLCALTGR